VVEDAATRSGPHATLRVHPEEHAPDATPQHISRPPPPVIVVITIQLLPPLRNQGDRGCRGDGGAGTTVGDDWMRKLRIPLLLSADMSMRPGMNALWRVNAEEMAAHHAGALTVGVRQANTMTALVRECR
jgi:hypothetical protein